MYGYDLPNGTWFVKMKIENEDLWNKIKEGELKGLSIEGYFTNKFEAMQKKEFTTEEIRTALKELLSKKKIKKVELATIGATRGKLTKLRNKASKWSAQLFQLSNEADEFGRQASVLEGEFAKLAKAAKELGVEDVVKIIEGDANAAKDLRNRAGDASDKIDKGARLLNLS